MKPLSVPGQFWLVTAVGLAIVGGSMLGLITYLQQHPAPPGKGGVCLPGSVRVCFSRRHRLDDQATVAIATSPDGQFLARSVQHQIEIWQVKTGKHLLSLPQRQNWVAALAFSPDSQWLASSNLDGTLSLWQWQTGQEVGRLASGRVTCLAFSPDGRFLATGSRINRWPDGRVSPVGVQLWELSSQSAILRIGSRPVAALAFSSHGYLAMGSNDTEVWQLAYAAGQWRKQRLHVLDSGEVIGLVFSRDGRQLVTGSRQLKFWQVASGQLIQDIPSSASDLALSPNGQVLATSTGGTINFWQLNTRSWLGTLRNSYYSSQEIAFALGGTALVTGSSDGLRLWQGRLDVREHSGKTQPLRVNSP